MSEKYVSELMKVVFCIKGLDESPYRSIEGLKQAMIDELVRVYHIYCEKANGGITDRLNEEFTRLYPNYFEETKGMEWYDRTEYNQFMTDGYMRFIVDKFNESNISPILNFYVDPEEIVFTGYLKTDRNVTIDFYLKPVEE